MTILADDLFKDLQLRRCRKLEGCLEAVADRANYFFDVNREAVSDPASRISESEYEQLSRLVMEAAHQ